MGGPAEPQPSCIWASRPARPEGVRRGLRVPHSGCTALPQISPPVALRGAVEAGSLSDDALFFVLSNLD